MLTVLVLAGCGESEPPGPPTLERASVLLLSLDTTRADALGCYGGPAWTTPLLDDLARGGVRFDAARTVAPITLPSHASLMTGREPFEHGVRDNATFVLPGAARTLAEALLDEGYATAAVTSAYVLYSSFGLAQGFEQYSDVPLRLSAEGEDERTARETVDEALHLLSELPRDRPFFLWVHLFDPHLPYSPPADVLATLPAEAQPDAVTDVPEKARRLYLGEVAFMDREIGRLLDGLAPFGGTEHVLTAVVADHGEALGDHGEPTHSFLIHEPTMRIPFLLRHGALPAGRQIADNVSLVDVAPTLLDLLGVGVPGTMSGWSLAPLLRGGDASLTALLEGRPLYGETAATWYTYGWAPLYSVVQGPWKVILGGGEAEVYDLASDPGETTDHAAPQAARVEQARAFLDDGARRTVTSQRRVLQEGEAAKFAELGYVVGTGGDEATRLPPGWTPTDRRHPRDGMQTFLEFSRATNLWNAGRQREALPVFVRLAREDPTNSVILGHTGAHLAESGRFEQALPLLRSAVALGGDSMSWHSLAICLHRTGKPDEAIEVLQQNLDCNPSFLRSRGMLGQLLFERGEYQAAIEQLERFVTLYAGEGPDLEGARRILAEARRRLTDQ